MAHRKGGRASGGRLPGRGDIALVLRPAGQLIAAIGGAGGLVAGVGPGVVGLEPERPGARLAFQFDAVGLRARHIGVVAEAGSAARNHAERVAGSAEAGHVVDLVRGFPLEPGGRHGGRPAQELLAHAHVPGIGRLRLQAEVPVLAVELVERRRLEALAEARPKDGRAGVGRPGQGKLTQGLAAEGLVVVAAQAGGEAEPRPNLPLHLKIGAVQPGRGRLWDRVGGEGAGRGCRDRRLLPLQAEDRLPGLGDGEGALVLVAVGLGLGLEGRADRAQGIDALAFHLGARDGQTIAQPAIEQIDLQARIADAFVRDAVLGGVGESEGGRGEAIDLDAAVGPGAAQIEGDAVGEGVFESAVHQGVLEAVILGAPLVGRDAVGGVVARAEAPQQAFSAPPKTAADIGGAVAAGLGGQITLQGLGGGGADHMDHPADGLAAPERRLRAAQHLDAGGVAGQQVGEVVAAAGRRRVGELDPIDHHHGLVALRAPDAQGGDPTGAAVARQGDAGRADQKVGQKDRLAGLDLGAVKHRDRLGDAGLGARRPAGGDHHAAKGVGGIGAGGVRGSGGLGGGSPRPEDHRRGGGAEEFRSHRVIPFSRA